MASPNAKTPLDAAAFLHGRTPSATYCRLSVQDTLAHLHANATTGLSDLEDIKRRQLVHGLNEFSVSRRGRLSGTPRTAVAF